MVSAAAVVSTVVDPELRVLTIADLGIVRDVTEDEQGRVTVTITPTYSGCPAMDVIRADIRKALATAGYPESTVVTQLDPAQTRMLTQRLDERPERTQAVRGMRLPLPLPHRNRRSTHATRHFSFDHAHPPPLSVPRRDSSERRPALTTQRDGRPGVLSTPRIRTLTLRTDPNARQHQPPPLLRPPPG